MNLTGGPTDTKNRQTRSLPPRPLPKAPQCFGEPQKRSSMGALSLDKFVVPRFWGVWNGFGRS